jgi:hypothetical protein
MRANGGPLAETLERVIRARGRLLQVDRAPLAGPAGARLSSALRFVFDVGVVTLRPGGAGADLEVEIASVPEPRSSVFVSASEDEPWWKLLGFPPTRVGIRAGGGVRVQFRGDQENPRWLALFSRDGGIEASLDD